MCALPIHLARNTAISDRRMFWAPGLAPGTRNDSQFTVFGAKLTSRPRFASSGSAPVASVVPSLKTSRPEVIWSMRFGRSNSQTRSIVCGLRQLKRINAVFRAR